MFILIAILLIAGIGLIFWFYRRNARSLSQIILTIQSIAKGKLDSRVPITTHTPWAQAASALNAMADQLESSVRQITAERDEMSAILSSMAETVVAVDLSGRIVLMNPAAENLFNVKQSHALHKSFLEVIRQAVINDLLRGVIENQNPQSKSFRLFLPEERFFEARAVPMQSSGQIIGSLLVLQDVTQIQKLEQIRRDFVANVSHELRTPLTSIQGYAETLLAGALHDSMHNREFVETIHKQAQRLTHIVNDLLNLASMESGKRKPAFASVNVLEIIQEIITLLSPGAQKREIHFDLHLPESARHVYGDRSLLKQIFMNLLDNAVKFNKDGGTVTIEGTIKDQFACLTVKDTGIGIPPEHLPRIFERFYLVDKARSRELGGTGLGLSIVKHAVEILGGSITVQSVVGEGTVFSLIFPSSS